MLDGDALNSSLDICNKFAIKGYNVSVVRMPKDRDAAQLNKDELFHLIVNRVKYDLEDKSTIIKLKMGVI
jgi:hypothetical protein